MKKDGGGTGDESYNGRPLYCIIALDLVVLTTKPQVSAALVKRLMKFCNNELLWQLAIRSSANLSSVMVIVKGSLHPLLLKLFLANTYFAHKSHHQIHPNSKQWHIIDFVIIRQGDRSLVHDTLVYRSIDCWSDHCLLGRLISVPCSHHHKSTSTHKTADVIKLEQLSEQQQYAFSVPHYYHHDTSSCRIPNKT